MGLALIAAVLTVQVLVLWGVYLHPNFSPTVSLVVNAFVAAIDLLYFVSFFHRSEILPFISDEWKGIFEKWEKKRPQFYANVMTLAKREHTAKG